MPRQTAKHEEDSGSDWDSVSEIGPPPSKQPVGNSTDRSPNQPGPLPHKLKSMTFVDPHMDKTQTKDDPPYDFKPEVSSSHRSDPLVRPGKGSKGRTYDPRHASAKRVTFEANDTGSQNKWSGQGNGGGQDSDSEDPLYSTVKPRSSRQKGGTKKPSEQSANTTPQVTNPSPKKLPSLKVPGSKKQLEGVDNAGYEDDDQLVQTDSGVQANPSVNSVRVPVIQPQTEALPKEDELMMREYEAHFARISDTRRRDSRECSPPLIMAVGGTSFDSFGKNSVVAVNRAMAESFAVITFPFTCLSLFLHHFLRFLLQGVVRPLVVDPLTLVVEFLVRPLVAGVVRPLLASVNLAARSLSDTFLVCVRPVTAVLNSFRLVEVNYTRRYSVEEI